MTERGRLGVTLPLTGLELHQHRGPLEQLLDAGFGEVWAGEVNGTDAPTSLALCGAWSADVVLSCAVVSAFTRGPALLASTAAALAEIAPGRCRFGVGAGSSPINRWNGQSFERPLATVEQTLRFLRRALSGEPSGGGFRLARRPSIPPLLALGAIAPRTMALAARDADGAVFNFVSPDDVRRLRSELIAAPRQLPHPLEVTSGIFVAIADDEAAADGAARRHLAGYLNVPTYAAHMVRLGRGEALEAMAAAWAAGDRREAVRQIPAEVVSDLVVSGTPDDCASRIAAYLDAGLDAATIALVYDPGDVPSPARQLEFLMAIVATHERAAA